MKRKLALLMAAVMTMSLLPTMNAFGATTQVLSGLPNVVPKKSVLYERTVWQDNHTSRAKSGRITGTNVSEDVEYGVDGTDILFKLDNDVKVGEQVIISLENARWFFRGVYEGPAVDGSKTVAGSALTAPEVLKFAQDASVNSSYDYTTVLSAGASSRFNWVIPYTSGNGLLSNEKWDWTAIHNAMVSAAHHVEPPTRVSNESYSSVTGTGTDTFTRRLYTTYNSENGAYTGGQYGDYLRFGETVDLRDWSNKAGDVDIPSRYNNKTFWGWNDAAAVATKESKSFTVSDYSWYDAYQWWTSAVENRTDFKAASLDNSNALTEPVLAGQLLSSAERDTTIELLGNILASFVARKVKVATTSDRAEVPYILQVNSSSDRIATLTVLPMFAGQTTYSGGDNWEIRVPMVVRTTDTGDVKVNISSSISGISGTQYLFSQTSGTASTKAFLTEYVTARNEFILDPLYIQETRLNSIGSDAYASTGVGLDNDETRGCFTLQAPTGFEWRDPNTLTSSGTNVVLPTHRETNVGTEPGLSWISYNPDRRSTTAVVATNAAWTGPGFSGDYNRGGVLGGVFGNYTTVDRDLYTAPYSVDLVSGTTTSVTPHNDYRIFYKNQGLTTEDRQTLVVELYNLQPSTNLMGKLYIEGLTLVADDNAKLGDVMVAIKDDRRWSAGVTDESFKVAVRNEWDIIFKTTGDIPTLVNGRYNKVDPLNSVDKDHLAAHVVFQEGSVAAWWAERQTVFSLPDQAKFRMVDFTTNRADAYLVDSYYDTLFETIYTSTLDTTANREGNIGAGIYINDGTKHGAVTVNGSTMTIDNMRVKTDKARRARLDMDMWITVESGFVGDVKLSVSGSAIPVQSNGGTVAPITIAKAVNPVNVTSKVTDIKIGYQYQTTSDIILTETASGMLEKGKDVYVSVSDLMSTDMMFSPDTKVAVTGGNLKIKNVSNTAIGYTSIAKGQTVLAGTGGTVSFNVDMASSQASTITISNVSVKIDRTVPETNKYAYKAIAWGPAIAPNYMYYEYNKDVKDKFAVAGIMTDYIKVISSASDKTSILTQEVQVSIGEAYFTVNGVPYDMDAAAYISTVSNSTMVPVRFIAYAFGIREDQVIWDDAQKTVTIVLPARVVQFKAASSTMLLDGSAVTMYSPDRLEVFAEIVGDRCYVPFRAMGEAFGVKVDWDDATQTAIYNPGAYTGATATETAVPTASPAPTATPAA